MIQDLYCSSGSQISDKPLKNIDHLIGVEQKFAIIKLDKLRGNGAFHEDKLYLQTRR